MSLKEYVFKKCKSELGHECFVTLEKPSEDELRFVCNESRHSVVNKNFAKFRCNGLLVVSIFDLVSNMKLYSIIHKTKVRSTRILTEYKVGSIVKPHHFDHDLEKVCTHGIHYFLSYQAAKAYNLKLGYIHTNDYVQYDENGVVLYK
jgi:hypothetical protein